MAEFSVSLEKIANYVNLDTVYAPADLDKINITSSEVNRPGLLLSGYVEFFDPTRIQILGNAEMGFIERLDEEKRDKCLDLLFSNRPPSIVVTRGLACPEKAQAKFKHYASKYEVPVFSTNEATSTCMSDIISLLSVELAQRITRHGVLVEVYGEGILILGESGVGKSETAIELVKRGHRLIADDAVELRKVSNRTIVGQAPENIRHFIELRGIGIVNVARIFGAGAVKTSEKIDMVVEFEPWDKKKHYSRTGLENNVIDILGIKIPLTLIPVMPGRNLAVILEIAAINNRQKAMGYNAALELLGQMGLKNDIEEETSTFL